MSKCTTAGKRRSTSLPSPAKRASLAECERLEALMAWNEGGFHYWPHAGGIECGVCTNGARLIAEKFGGFVAGYEITPGESRALVGANVFGHDFAVVGEFLVDWWGWQYEQSIESPVFRIVEGIALGKCKPKNAWQVHPDNDSRSP
jgi:hypothetical protein